MNRRSAGLTLIELMVTVAIMSLLMVAALSVFVAMTETQRLNERIGEASANKLIGAAVIQFDVQNAGYRLPVPAFAVRHHNNVTVALSLPSVGAPITTAANCAGPARGVVPGTDVLEVSQGGTLVQPGKVAGVVASGGTTFEVTLDSSATSMPSAPFLLEESDVNVPGNLAIGTLLVFARGPLPPPAPADDGAFCLARVTEFTQAPADPVRKVKVQLVTRNGANVPAVTYYPNCPETGQRVFRVTAQTRYMVCASAGDQPNQFGLYRQESNGVAWQDPLLIQQGIEDLQVSLRYLNRGGIVTATGSGVDCIGAGNGRLCYCDEDPVVPTCTVPGAQQDAALAALTPNSMVALVRGLRVRLVATGDRPASSDTGTRAFVRPAAFDRAAALPAARDNYVRVIDTLSFSGSNLLVVP